MSERWEQIRDESPEWEGSDYSPTVQIRALCKRLTGYEAEIKRLGEALEWYAGEGTGDAHEFSVIDNTDNGRVVYNFARFGDTAREALDATTRDDS